MPYLTAAGLERLKNYRYGSALNGFVDRVIMTPWWNFLINFFPTWLAPNLMTLIALMHTGLAYALLLYYAFYQEGPRWVYFLSAYCFFGYQTLDALDGKQARRVGASSPLGQLFDHGCDSICAVFSGFIVSAALQTGVSWTTVGVMYAHMLPFFSSNWECAHTDHMRFGAIGVTEAQFSIMGVLIATGIWGTQLWSYTVMGLELRMIVLLVCGSIAVLHTISSIQMVAKHYEDKGEDPSEAWSQLREFSALCVLSFSLFCAPSPHYWRSHEDFAMLLMLVGLLFSYLVTRLIVCHVTAMKFGHWHQILTPLPLLVVNSFARYLIGNYILCEPILLTAYVTVIIGMYAHFIYFVIHEIATALNIRVLTLDPDRPKKD